MSERREERAPAVRLYALLLALLPDDFDPGLRRDAVETLVDLRRAARLRGRLAVVRTTLRCLRLAVGVVAAERREARRLAARSKSASRPGDPMDSLRHDLVTALRAFRHRPGFTATSILIMALGIAAATTLFSVVDGVMLRPLPYPDAERLVYFDQGSHPVPLFETWRDELDTVDVVEGAYGEWAVLTGEHEPARIQDLQVTEGFLDLFAARPALGRLLEPADFARREKVAVLGHHLWRTRWGADPAILGRRITLDGEPFTVVGVMAADFRMPEIVEADVDAWRPLDPEPEHAGSWSFYILSVVGRLADGATLAAAADEVRAIDLRVAEEHPEERHDRQGNPALTPVLSLREATVAGSRERLWILLGAGLAVLLVGCANVAGLGVARGQERLRDLAVREALGAGRLRLVRQLLVESVLLALAGGALGIALAHAGLRSFLALQPGDLPRLADVAIDPRILAIAVAATAVCGLLCGTAPAFQAARADLERALRAGSAATAGRSRSAGRPLFVVFEVALSLMLLASAGLLLHSLANRIEQPAGFETAGLVRLPLQLPEGGLGATEDEEAARVRTVGQLVEELEALPEIESAAVTWTAPFTYFGRGRCCWRTSLAPEGGAEAAPRSLLHPATPGYLGTLGARLLVGRDLADGDAGLDPVPIVVNRHLAGELLEVLELPGEPTERSALAGLLGRRLELGGSGDAVEVVGVVEHLHEWGPALETEAVSYAPYERFGGEIGLASVVARTRVELDAPLADRLRAAIWRVDPTIPVPTIESMEERRAVAFAQPRFYSVVVALFAAAGLLLAAAGLFATLHTTVGRRRREMGIRMALGARRQQLVRLVLRQGFGWLAAGLAVGWVATAALSRVLRSELFGVGPADPWTVAMVSALLLASGLAACWLPARRAAAVDPVRILRAD